MRLIDRIYINFAELLPHTYRKNFAKLLVYAGVDLNADIWLGSALMLGFFVFTIIIIIPWAFFLAFTYKYIFYAFLALALVNIAAYLVIYFKAEDRTNKVEDSLPDALQLVSANIRSGMTPFQALKFSARKEFGPLKEVVDYAIARALGTESFADVLMKMSERIRSEIFERTLKLFTSSMKSGGKLAKLLEELSNDIAETRGLKRELVTNTKSYQMFIMFTIIVGTPLLLATAIHFIGMITETQQVADIGTTGSFGLNILSGEIAITASFLNSISIVFLIVTAVLAAILIGVIAEGKPKYGFKWAPIIITGCLVMFYISKYFISWFIGGMM